MEGWLGLLIFENHLRVVHTTFHSVKTSTQTQLRQYRIRTVSSRALGATQNQAHGRAKFLMRNSSFSARLCRSDTRPPHPEGRMCQIRTNRHPHLLLILSAAIRNLPQSTGFTFLTEHTKNKSIAEDVWNSKDGCVISETCWHYV